MRYRIRALLAGAVLLVAPLLHVEPARAAPGVLELFSSVPASGGILPVRWGGGDVDALSSAARAQGCEPGSLWAFLNGRPVGFVVGAPPFVNAGFAAAYPAGLPADSILLVLCLAPPVQDPHTAGLNAEVASTIVVEMNRERAAQGLPPLVVDSRLQAAAEAYALVLLDRDPYLTLGVAAHSLDGEPWDRAQRAGYPSGQVSENIGYIARSGTFATSDLGALHVQYWMASPGHRANILDSRPSDVGVGCWVGRPDVAHDGYLPDLLSLCVVDFGAP